MTNRNEKEGSKGGPCKVIGTEVEDSLERKRKKERQVKLEGSPGSLVNRELVELISTSSLLRGQSISFHHQKHKVRRREKKRKHILI
jgi:hypothetical protein